MRFTKPALPATRGAMTVADIAAANETTREGAILAWAQTTWQAHADLHHWARQRVAEAQR